MTRVKILVFYNIIDNSKAFLYLLKIYYSTL